MFSKRKDTMSGRASDRLEKIGRRAFLAGIATAAAAPVLAQERNYGPQASPIRYPEPDVIAIEKRFAKYKIASSAIQRLYTGTLWAEGCAWNGVGRFLLWSDIPNNV